MYEVHRRHIRELFLRLRRDQGMIARMNYRCCQGCASAELAANPQHQGRAAVFFHQQDNASAFPNRSDVMKNDLYLAYGVINEDDEAALRVVGEKIVREAQALGMEVVWDGDVNRRIAIKASA